jgi:hypothetical protein
VPSFAVISEAVPKLQFLRRQAKLVPQFMKTAASLFFTLLAVDGG